MKKYYDDNFYRNRQKATNTAAYLILDHVLSILPHTCSAVDLGCGVGAWLAVLREKGVATVLGIDGPWVNQAFLAIEPSEFQQMDFSQPLTMDGHFDLAISLEVGEHLPAAMADQFVENLANLADFVLFSAAPPLQGGTNHINEQPIDYWLEKFAHHGYKGVDCIRPHFWNDKRIGPWYRQNTILLVKACRLPELTLSTALPEPAGYLHPEIFLQKLSEAHTVQGAWKLLRRAIKSWIKGFLFPNAA